MGQMDAPILHFPGIEHGLLSFFLYGKRGGVVKGPEMQHGNVDAKIHIYTRGESHTSCRTVGLQFVEGLERAAPEEKNEKRTGLA